MVLQDLAPLTEYDVWVEAINSVGKTKGTIVQFQTCGAAPSRPRPPSVADTTAKSIGLVWQKAVIRGTIPLYIVRIGNQVVYRDTKEEFVTADTSALEQGKTYSITLEVCIENGCSQAYQCAKSTALSYHTADRAHIGQPHTYVLSDSSIDIDWQPPRMGSGSVGKVTYIVYRGDTAVYTGASLSHLDLQLKPPGTTFEYRVRAKNENGLDIVSPSQAATLTKGAPNGITPPRLTVKTSDLIEACWDAPIDPQGRIERYGLIVNDAERYFSISATTKCQFIDKLDPFTGALPYLWPGAPVFQVVRTIHYVWGRLSLI